MTPAHTRPTAWRSAGHFRECFNGAVQPTKLQAVPPGVVYALLLWGCQMEIRVDTVLPAPAVDRRWLWVVRLALLAYLFVSLAAVPMMPAHLLNILPWALPYLLLLLGIQRERYREAALMLAVVIGALGMAVWLGVFCFAHVGVGGGLAWDSTESILFGLLAATNLLVFLSAHKAIRKRTLGVRAVRGAGELVVVCAFVLAGLLVIGSQSREAPRTARNESSATSLLRTINTAQVTYANTYDKGYARTLAVLGPPPEGSQPSENAADLIDRVQATGQRQGYRFMFIPGPPHQTGAIISYHVFARPLEYGQSGVRSFYTDESGVIRATREDRAATAQDPPL